MASLREVISEFSAMPNLHSLWEAKFTADLDDLGNFDEEMAVNEDRCAAIMDAMPKFHLCTVDEVMHSISGMA